MEPRDSAKPKKRHTAKRQREQLAAQTREALAKTPDPFSRENVRKIGLRVGIPLVIVWVIALVLPGWIFEAVLGGVTIVLAGLVVYLYRLTRKSRAMADLVRHADTAEARQEALEQLESKFKKSDTGAIFAKAQLQLQDNDSRGALATLETIKLDKVMAPVADQARGQRAMIHLLLGETDNARALVDNVELSRHKEPKERAMLAAIVGEAWARSGQARKAIEMLETFDLDDELYEDLRPQMYRSLAFAYAWSNKTKKMKQSLRKLSSINAQLLAGFVTKKKLPMGVSPRGVHPALEKEALAMLMRSGALPRKMQVKRL